MFQQDDDPKHTAGVTPDWVLKELKELQGGADLPTEPHWSFMEDSQTVSPSEDPHNLGEPKRVCWEEPKLNYNASSYFVEQMLHQQQIHNKILMLWIHFKPIFVYDYVTFHSYL